MNFSSSPDGFFSNFFGRSRSSFTPETHYSSPVVDTVLPAVAVFGFGLLVGAGIALLVAPKPGWELREDIASGASRLGENLRERLPVKRSADELAEA